MYIYSRITNCSRRVTIPSPARPLPLSSSSPPSPTLRSARVSLVSWFQSFASTTEACFFRRSLSQIESPTFSSSHQWWCCCCCSCRCSSCSAAPACCCCCCYSCSLWISNLVSRFSSSRLSLFAATLTTSKSATLRRRPRVERAVSSCASYPAGLRFGRRRFRTEWI